VPEGVVVVVVAVLGQELLVRGRERLVRDVLEVTQCQQAQTVEQGCLGIGHRPGILDDCATP
jgi:hypothetical protein